MKAWEYFWTVSLLISAAAFAGITVIVSLRGFRDLKTMFAKLREQATAMTTKAE